MDEEVVLVVLDDRVTDELDHHFDEDLGYSEELDLERWERRNPAQHALERVLHVARPWM